MVLRPTEEHNQAMSDTLRSTHAHRPGRLIAAGLLLASAPLLILVVPAILGLPIVEPLLHESQFYPGFSRAFLVAIPLAGLVVVNLVIFAANRSLRPTLAASIITSILALYAVLGGVGLVNAFDGLGGFD